VAVCERLQLGFLVGADDQLVRTQPAAFEASGVQVEHAVGLGAEVGVAHEQP